MTTQNADWPGTREHQALLRALAAHYSDDPRVRAVGVFGSLGRGNWDEYSDLDLDVVVADEVKVDPVAELRALCESFASIGETAALIFPDSEDAGEVVLRSGRMLSVRYHALATTSPNIIDSLCLVAGSLSLDEIIAAGQAQAVARPAREPLERLLDRCVRHAVEVHSALERGRLWTALELLHRMRGMLMRVYGLARAASRPDAAFEREAPPALQARLAAAVPRLDPVSMRAALVALLVVLADDLTELSDGQAALSEGQRHLVELVRLKQGEDI